MAAETGSDAASAASVGRTTGAAEGRSCSNMGEEESRGGGGRRRRRRQRRRRKGVEDDSPEAAAERQRVRLREARSELKHSGFWDSCLRTILKSLRNLPTAEQDVSGKQQEALAEEVAPEEPKGNTTGLQCVCYGLGNFCSCGKARLQLALLLLVLEELKISTEMCFVFDPVFSTLEIDVLVGLGLTVLQWNEEGKRSIGGPTLFYMIHCGKALYNNLLWSNWSMEALSQMVVIGNSFRGFEESLLSRVFHENYCYIAKVLSATEEEALPPHPEHLEAFNDTSVHCFPLHQLRDLPPESWAYQEEPVYQEEVELEIIRNKP